MSRAQEKFTRALLDPILPVPEGLVDGAVRAAGRRFDVYRNNVATSLIEAIYVGFPVVTRLIGQQNMNVLAGAFVRAHPPSAPVLTRYGTEFPRFLENAAQLAHLGYLPDVARLELAIRHSYHAGDASPIAPGQLAEIKPNALLQVTVRFAPAVRLVRSDWPIHDIWQFNTNDNAATPQPGAQDVLITRPEFEPGVHLLPNGGADWIQALMGGKNIGAALDAACAKTPEFGMTFPLTLLLQGDAIVSLAE
jgi:putative DNA-binding protein